MFRMIHTRRPLQEKMTLFWHNHFATGFSKLADDSGMVQGAKMLAHKPGVLRGPQGQIELFRQYALGNFRDLLLEVAKDPAMLVWLDGHSNTKAKPQENFGREIMELFTVGVGYYTEPDVYAAARVFTGWNLQRSAEYTKDDYGDMNAYQEFVWRPEQHETSAKTFSFPVYSDGSRTIPARSESEGMQDGIDLINALAIHPETARRLARKFWGFFVSETQPPDPAFVEASPTSTCRTAPRSDRSSLHPHLAVVHQSRDALCALRLAGGIRHAGDQRGGLAEPLARQGPIADGRHGPCCCTSRPMSRMAPRRRLVLDRDDAGANELRGDDGGQPEGVPRRLAASDGRNADGLLATMLDRVTPAPFDQGPQQALMTYLLADGGWTGSESQLTTERPDWPACSLAAPSTSSFRGKGP